MTTNRVFVVAATLLAFSACTSATPTSPVLLTSSPTVANSSSVAAGLRPVRNYAQEFCSGSAVPSHCPKGAVPAALRRPLHIPTIEPGATCPVSQANPQIWARAAPGLGPGPVAPVGLGEQATLLFRHFPGSHWGGQKVLWVAAPAYDGPVLIRGSRVDGTGGLGFEDDPPLAEFQLPPGNEQKRTNHGGYRAWPSYTRVRAPGCYAYQVDGTDFSYTIVFRATRLA